MYSHTHVNYALQTMCIGRTLGQAALRLREERAMCWLVSKDTERKGAPGELSGGWRPVSRKKFMKAESYRVRGYHSHVVFTGPR